MFMNQGHWSGRPAIETPGPTFSRRMQWHCGIPKSAASLCGHQGRCSMGDSSPKSKNKQKQQDSSKKKNSADAAAKKQAPPTPTFAGKKSGK